MLDLIAGPVRDVFGGRAGLVTELVRLFACLVAGVAELVFGCAQLVFGHVDLALLAAFHAGGFHAIVFFFVDVAAAQAAGLDGLERFLCLPCVPATPTPPYRER